MSYNGYNIAEKGGAPAKNRFTDPDALSALYSKLTNDDQVESQRRVKIRKMYDGNLPYDPVKLAQCGLKNIANVNFLGLKGVIDNRADAVMRLSSDTTNLVEIRPLAPEIAGPDAVRISDVVAEEFSTTVRDTGKMIPALSMMNREADLYGIGPVAWPSSEDYNPIALERGQIRFIANGPVNSSMHELIMFETVIPAHYLFYLLDHPEDAAIEGWDVSAVKRWVVDVFRNGFETKSQPGVEGDTTYVESTLSLIRQNRFEEEHQFDELHVIHAFVKEMAFPRGITHIIMPSSEHKSFLFQKKNAYMKMDECFLWFPFSVNERYARAVRGLASFLYPIELLNNRFTCQMVDVAFRAASFVLAQKTAGAQQNLTINEQGPYTVIPADYAPAQAQVAPNIQQLAQMKQMLDGIGINSVTGSDKGPLGTTGVKMQQGPDRQTKAEVELQQRLRAHKEEALFVQRITVFDKIFRESFRRFVRIATSGDQTKLADYPEIIEFIERCARRGVTLDMIAAIPGNFTVATCRDLILGSEGVVGVLQEIFGNFGGNFDDTGRRSGTREMVKLRLGAKAADRLIPEISRDQAPSAESSHATVENGMMKLGQAVQVGQDELHWSHIPVHAQLLQEIVELVKARPDSDPTEEMVQHIENPKQTLAILQACSKHVQEHLAIGGQNIGKKDDAKKVAAMLRDLRPTVKALNLAVATQERVEQAQKEKQERELQELKDRADQTELEKAKYEIDRKAEIDKYRADRDHEVAMSKLELEKELAGRKSDLQASAAAKDAARRDAETDAKLDREKKMTDAKINAAAAVGRMDAVQDITGFGQTSPDEIANPDGSGAVPFSI